MELGLNGGISPKEVETALEQHRDVQAVVITSPTYDGILSDVKGIAQAAHRHGVPLIVDEAHGAHLPFHERFPRSALYLGADLVIQSLHKTLPSLTQTAVLHRQSEMVPEEKLDRFSWESIRPAVLPMSLWASMAACLRYLEEEGKQAFDRYVFRLEQCRERLGQMKNLYLPDREICGQGNIFDLDLSKILVSGAGTGIEGPVLHRILRGEIRTGDGNGSSGICIGPYQCYGYGRRIGKTDTGSGGDRYCVGSGERRKKRNSRKNHSFL